MTQVQRKVAILVALGVSFVLGSVQSAMADHECAYGGYDRHGIVSSGHSYRSGTVYYVRQSYPTHGHGYSFGQQYGHYRRPATHSGAAVYSRRSSHPQRNFHHRHHD